MKLNEDEAMKVNQTASGFSLVELLVVVTIIGITSGSILMKYKRDASKDNLLRAAGQVTSLLRGASAAGLAVGRNVVVLMDATTNPELTIWIDDDYDQIKDAGESVIGTYDLTYTDVKFEYIRGAPAKLEFLHRGDSRYNKTGPGGGPTDPNYATFDGVFLRLSTGPTTPATSEDAKWVSYKLYSRTSFVEVIKKYAT